MSTGDVSNADLPLAVDVNDFSNLSLHQAKRMEMECQVKVLELENLLEKERLKLASVRRTHYHLAESLSANDSTS